MKAKTRSMLSLCLAVVLVMSAVLGTIAYMTASSSKTNTFTVGSFNKPTTDPDDSSDLGDLEGFILEKKWDAEGADHKLVPGQSLDKDPQVGIGVGSEAAYIYVLIQNNAGEGVTFELNDGWTAVQADQNEDGSYKGGLFRYNDVLAPTTADAWTNTIFDQVSASATATISNPASMTVYAYIHQAYDNSIAGDDKSIPLDGATGVDAAAIAWAANPSGN